MDIEQILADGELCQRFGLRRNASGGPPIDWRAVCGYRTVVVIVHPPDTHHMGRLVQEWARQDEEAAAARAKGALLTDQSFQYIIRHN